MRKPIMAERADAAVSSFDPLKFDRLCWRITSIDSPFRLVVKCCPGRDPYPRSPAVPFAAKATDFTRHSPREKDESTTPVSPGSMSDGASFAAAMTFSGCCKSIGWRRTMARQQLLPHARRAASMHQRAVRRG